MPLIEQLSEVTKYNWFDISVVIKFWGMPIFIYTEMNWTQQYVFYVVKEFHVHSI